MDLSDFVRIFCQSGPYELHIPLSTPIATLKSIISERHCFDPGVRLVFNGALLDSKSTLAQSGVFCGSLIVAVPPQSQAILRIISKIIPEFEFTVFLNSSVSELRAALAAKFGICGNELNLVNRGNVLEDGYCLGHYDLANGSIVYTVRVRSAVTARARPSQLVSDLRGKIQKFVSASPAQQRRLTAEITDLLNNPVLHSFSRIDQTARLVADDARLVLEAAENRGTSQMNQVVATMNDQTMTLFETTAAGIRLLWDAVKKDSGKRAAPPLAMLPTRLDFEAGISEEALPIWWSSWSAVGEPGVRTAKDRPTPIREKFSREIRELKRMGFGDESVILMALKETSGNVQRAAKLLQRHVPNRCA
jgi:hypothetical protein